MYPVKNVKNTFTLLILQNVNLAQIAVQNAILLNVQNVNLIIFLFKEDARNVILIVKTILFV